MTAALPPYLLFSVLTVLIYLIVDFANRIDIVDPDARLDAPSLTRRWGYPAEAHNVTTRDGYILEIHRVPYGRNDDGPSTGRPVVLLMHGLHGSSYNWIINRPEQSAGFMLADAGYDVWMGNCRGNMYGMKHTHRPTLSHSFWDFTWQEMADFDLPSTIDVILEKTGQDSLFYVTHSQGFAVVNALLATDESYAKKVKSIFGLGPVWSNHYSHGPAVWMSYQRPLYEMLYHAFGSKQYHAKGSYVTSVGAKYVCALPGLNYGCGMLLEVFGGVTTSQMNYTRSSVYMTSTPGGSSTKNMIHWAQICHKGKTRRFDYGEKKNMERYGVRESPVYDLSRIQTPVYLYWSKEDWIADGTDLDVNYLPYVNSNVVKESSGIANFNHFDFVFGTQAAERIYKPILSHMNAALNRSSSRSTVDSDRIHRPSHQFINCVLRNTTSGFFHC